MDATDDDSDDDPLERGSSLAMAMLDASAHSRCDFGVIECCMRIVYPPANDEAGPASSQENTACGRVADEKSASQGFDDDEDLGLLIYEVVGGVAEHGGEGRRQSHLFSLFVANLDRHFQGHKLEGRGGEYQGAAITIAVRFLR